MLHGFKRNHTVVAGMLFRLTHPHEVDGSSAAKGPAQAYASLTQKPFYSDMLIEFVGTFLLSFTVACAAGQGAPLAALSIGSIGRRGLPARFFGRDHGGYAGSNHRRGVAPEGCA